MRKLLAVGAFVAAAAVATQSQATTYLLNTSQDLGNASYGAVNVTDVTLNGAAALKYVVTLNSGFGFVDNGNGHVDFAFSLKSDPTLGLSTDSPLSTSYVTLPGGPGWSLTQSPNGISNSPYGGFDYGLNCTKDVCGPNLGGYTGGAATGAIMTFYVTAPGITDNWVDTAGADKAYFAVDVRNNTTKATGAVAAFSFTDAVPEPATWATMILGVFSIGLALRLRRRGEAQPVSA